MSQMSPSYLTVSAVLKHWDGNAWLVVISRIMGWLVAHDSRRCGSGKADLVLNLG